MTPEAVVVIIVVAFLLAIALAGSSIRIVRQYECGVVHRLGRALPGVREPGVTLVVPFIDRLHRISMQTHTVEVSPEDLVTRDNVALRVGAAVDVRVTDPAATLNVADHLAAVGQLAATTLRSFVGHCDFDELAASRREEINAQLHEALAEMAEESWGLRIEQAEVVVPEGSSSTGTFT